MLFQCVPGEGVRSRKIVEGVDRGLVGEAFEAGSVVVVDEADEEVVSFLVAVELVLAGVAAGSLSGADGGGDAPVEALDHAVGLRPIRSGEAVLDGLPADDVEGVVAGGTVVGLALHVDGEAVGELAAIVGEDGVDRVREVRKEAPQEAGGGLGVASRMDLQVDVASGPVDGDKGIALLPPEGRQVLDVDMDEADASRLEGTDRRFVGLGPTADAVALEAAMDGAARQLGVDAAAHHLGDVVERQVEAAAQLADQPFLEFRQLGGDPLRHMRTVGDRIATAPAADGGLTDAELGGENRHRRLAVLNVGPDLRRRRGVGVQVQFHDARRSLTQAMPRSTPILSNQSPGTKHEGRGWRALPSRRSGSPKARRFESARRGDF